MYPSKNNKFVQHNFLFEDSEEIVIGFKNVHNSIVASIRRIIMSNIKNSAMNERKIEIIKNNSAYNDDTLKHRISLIPIDCAEGTVIELNYMNTTDTEQYVTSDDLKLVSNKNAKRKEIIAEDVIIGILQPGDEIQLIATVDCQTPIRSNTAYSVSSTPGFGFVNALYVRDDPACITEVKKYLEDTDVTIIQDKYNYNTNVSAPPGFVCLGLSYNILTINTKDVCKLLKLKKINSQRPFFIRRIPDVRTLRFETFIKSPRAVYKAAVKILMKNIRNLLIMDHNKTFERDDKLGISRTTIEVNKFNKTSVIAFSSFLDASPHVEMAQYKMDHQEDKYLSWIIVTKGNMPLQRIIINAYKLMKRILNRL